MTDTTTGTTTSRTVPLAELQRAWRAVRAGDFATDTPYAAGRPPQTSWPRPEGPVIPVLGCTGSAGATTTALALATAAAAPAANRSSVRLIECAPAHASGLAGAATAELGTRPTGWRQGRRDTILLERANTPATTPVMVPVPGPETGAPDLTLVDVGWDPTLVLAEPGWLRDLVTGADQLLLVTPASVPGLRRLDGVLAALTQVRDTSRDVAAVTGVRRARWPRPARQAFHLHLARSQLMGPQARRLDETGRVIGLPLDARLAAAGIDPQPLPPPLVTAAGRLLDRLTSLSTKGPTPS